MAKKKKKKLKLDRVFIALIIGVVVLFMAYKTVIFVTSGIQNIFKSEKPVEEIVEEPIPTIATVVIDPGHGGKDGGTTNGKIYEKDIALKTGLLLGKELEKQNIKVVYTRTTDMHLDDRKVVDLSMRAAFSQKYNADYYISIHVNDFDKSTDVSGFEIYKKDDNSESLAENIGTEIEKLNYSKNRGIQDGRILQVLKENVAPSVLIELGYIRGKDISYLTDNEKLSYIAQAISKGIMVQIETNK